MLAAFFEVLQIYHRARRARERVHLALVLAARHGVGKIELN
jgi:hypothetical protein